MVRLSTLPPTLLTLATVSRSYSWCEHSAVCEIPSQRKAVSHSLLQHTVLTSKVQPWGHPSGWRHIPTPRKVQQDASLDVGESGIVEKEQRLEGSGRDRDGTSLSVQFQMIEPMSTLATGCRWRAPPACRRSFFYRGKKHKGCVEAKDNSAWCSHHTRFLGKWSRCKSSCEQVGLSQVAAHTRSPELFALHAALSDRGYRNVALTKSHSAMESYVRRVAYNLGCNVADEGALQGLVPFYSGEVAYQSFAALEAELYRACVGGQGAGTWLTSMISDRSDADVTILQSHAGSISTEDGHVVLLQRSNSSSDDSPKSKAADGKDGHVVLLQRSNSSSDDSPKSKAAGGKDQKVHLLPRSKEKADSEEKSLPRSKEKADSEEKSRETKKTSVSSKQKLYASSDTAAHAHAKQTSSKEKPALDPEDEKSDEARGDSAAHAHAKQTSSKVKPALDPEDEKSDEARGDSAAHAHAKLTSSKEKPALDPEDEKSDEAWGDIAGLAHSKKPSSKEKPALDPEDEKSDEALHSRRRRKNECEWQAPRVCMQSFIYKGMKYNGCVIGESAAWCSHDAVYKGKRSSCKRVCTPPTSSETSSTLDSDDIAVAAPFNNKGYKDVAKLKDHSAMETYIRRVINSMGCRVAEEGSLQGVIPFYSGEKAVQSFDRLEAEVYRECTKKHSWLSSMYPDGSNSEKKEKERTSSTPIEDKLYSNFVSALQLGSGSTPPSVSGSAAPITEDGLKSVQLLGDEMELQKYIRRVVSSMHGVIVDESGLHGLIPFYSGEKSALTLGSLMTEIAVAMQKPNGWIMKKSSTAALEVAPAAPMAEDNAVLERLQNISRASRTFQACPGKMDELHKLQKSVGIVPLSEEGYEALVPLKSDCAMMLFMERVIEDLQCEIIEEAPLKGLVPFYSGTEGVQDFIELHTELKGACSMAGNWVEPKAKAVPVVALLNHAQDSGVGNPLSHAEVASSIVTVPSSESIAVVDSAPSVNLMVSTALAPHVPAQVQALTLNFTEEEIVASASPASNLIVQSSSGPHTPTEVAQPITLNFSRTAGTSPPSVSNVAVAPHTPADVAQPITSDPLREIVADLTQPIALDVIEKLNASAPSAPNVSLQRLLGPHTPAESVQQMTLNFSQTAVTSPPSASNVAVAPHTPADIMQLVTSNFSKELDDDVRVPITVDFSEKLDASTNSTSPPNVSVQSSLEQHTLAQSVQVNFSQEADASAAVNAERSLGPEKVSTPVAVLDNADTFGMIATQRTPAPEIPFPAEELAGPILAMLRGH